MKRLLALLVTFLLIFSLFACADSKTENAGDTANEPAYGKILYVSPDGNDDNVGDEDSPLATMAGARDAVRRIKAEAGLPDGGVCVLFADGEYKIDATVEFAPEDSGEEGKPIVYRSKNSRGAVFNAGLNLRASDFVPASDEIKAKLLSEEAKEHLLEIDLEAVGFTDFEEREYYIGAGSKGAEDPGTTEPVLYAGGKRQTVSRWPNEGFYRIPEYITMEETPHYNTFTVADPSGHSILWADEAKPHYCGYPSQDYFKYHLDVTNIDRESGNVSIHVEADWMADDCPVYFYDLLCELDAPGEYYIDYGAKKLYYYPTDGFAEESLLFTKLSEDIVGGETDHITFSGFVMKGTRNDAFELTGNYLSFEDIEVENIGVAAMMLDGHDINVSGCYIHNIDGMGINIDDPSWRTDDPDTPTNMLEYSNVVIYNNEICFYGEKYGISSPAVYTYRFGTLISHNLIHDNMHNAIYFEAQDVTIEYNEIYHCCHEVDDGGVISTGRNRDARGTVLRYNYIHDITHDFGGHPKAIYLDDTTEQHTVYGNVIVNCDGRAIAVSGDRYLTVENNILVNTENISWDSRGTTWLESLHWDYPNGYMWVNLLNHPIYSALWRYSFPMNLVYGETSPHLPIYVDYFGTPAYANICRNVACNYKQDLYTAIAEQMNEPGMWETCYFRFGGIVAIHDNALKYGTFLDNATYLTEDEVGFVDYKNGNFNLRDDSIVYRDIIGFEKLPFDEIGLVK